MARLSLGEKLCNLRKKKKMSQQEVADATKMLDPHKQGISQSVYCRYEGDRKPEIDPEDVELLAKVFEVDYKYLMETINPLVWYDEDIRDFILSQEGIPYIRQAFKQFLADRLAKM